MSADRVPTSRTLGLGTEVQYLKGVGPRWAEVLAAKGIFTIEDLILTLPFRYEDRSRLLPVHALVEGETATVVVQVRTLSHGRTRGGLQLLEMLAGDGTGNLRCIWYHAEYFRDRFQSGQTLALYGRLTREAGRLAMRQPEFEVLETEKKDDPDSDLGDSIKLGRIVPVYEAIGPLTAARLRTLVYRALASLPPALEDPLPAELRARHRLPGRRQALDEVHFPPPDASLDLLQQARTPGHRRLIFEELFFLQAGLELKRRRMRRQPGPAIALNPGIRDQLKRVLAFHPTSDQKQALKEIAADLCSGHPMRRLLQGDVGSGKTIVALEAAIIAIENGWQVALMAPTQILAEQHYLYARSRLPGYRVALVTGAQNAALRRRAAAAEPQLVIGTQALLEEHARLPRLGLVIVDEQHRFGVLQRFHLMRAGAAPAAAHDAPPPHLLVMTATPIPRTLALTLYGDLDASLLRHPPPGALPITTRAVPSSRAPEVYEFVRAGLARGRQAYFVYPLIEESEALDLKPALRMFDHLRALFPEFRLGLLHGALHAAEKQAVMAGFRAGDIHALVSTSVIEVGVDVPNATFMVIEHAERFGLAQLHQLRGRIGRPQPLPVAPRDRSCCFLLHGELKGTAARQRLRALVRTRDGFELAELDLTLRGPGEFFGTRQSGLPLLTVAQPVRDQELMELARSEIRTHLDTAAPSDLKRLVALIQQRWQRRYGLVEAG